MTGSSFFLISLIKEQDQKFNEMIEAEHLKAELAQIKEKEEKEKEEIEAVTRSIEREKRLKFKEGLAEEPSKGELIQIAFRLPTGKRVSRKFTKQDPIKVFLF